MVLPGRSEINLTCPVIIICILGYINHSVSLHDSNFRIASFSLSMQSDLINMPIYMSLDSIPMNDIPDRRLPLLSFQLYSIHSAVQKPICVPLCLKVSISQCLILSNLLLPIWQVLCDIQLMIGESCLNNLFNLHNCLRALILL